MKINPINTTNRILPNQNTKNQVSFKSETDYDTFEKTDNIEDKKLMANTENYKILRDKFGEKLEKATHKAELAAWNFYTNSTPENMHKFSHTEEEMHELYKDEKLY
jgi:hypothetical protein